MVLKNHVGGRKVEIEIFFPFGEADARLYSDPQLADLKSLFDAMDKDGSGYVGTQELLAYCKVKNITGLSKDLIQENLQVIRGKQYGDEQLKYDDFLKLLAPCCRGQHIIFEGLKELLNLCFRKGELCKGSTWGWRGADLIPTSRFFESGVEIININLTDICEDDLDEQLLERGNWVPSLVENNPDEFPSSLNGLLTEQEYVDIVGQCVFLQHVSQYQNATWLAIIFCLFVFPPLVPFLFFNVLRYQRRQNLNGGLVMFLERWNERLNSRNICVSVMSRNVTWYGFDGKKATRQGVAFRWVQFDLLPGARSTSVAQLVYDAALLEAEEQELEKAMQQGRHPQLARRLSADWVDTMCRSETNDMSKEVVTDLALATLTDMLEENREAAMNRPSRFDGRHLGDDTSRSRQSSGRQLRKNSSRVLSPANLPLTPGGSTRELAGSVSPLLKNKGADIEDDEDKKDTKLASSTPVIRLQAAPRKYPISLQQGTPMSNSGIDDEPLD